VWANTESSAGEPGEVPVCLEEALGEVITEMDVAAAAAQALLDASDSDADAHAISSSSTSSSGSPSAHVCDVVHCM
jgi:hypothetical protein